MSFKGTDTYIASDDLQVAVNAAVTMEKPLLIKGEPGTGKTLLAYEVAKSLNKQLFTWHIKSTTTAQQGLYEYDAVSRLRDSQLGEDKVNDIPEIEDNRDVNTDEDNTTDIPEIEDNQDDDVDNTTNGDREEFVVGMNSFQHKLMKDIKTLRELRETLSSETNKIWADPNTSKICDNDLDKEEEINVWKKHKKQKNKLRLKNVDVAYSPKRCVYCGWFSKSRSLSNSSHSLNRHIQVKHQNKK